MFAAISQVKQVTSVLGGFCMGVRQEMALIGDANQAMGEGKSGLVETRQTELAATALY